MTIQGALPAKNALKRTAPAAAYLSSLSFAGKKRADFLHPSLYCWRGIAPLAVRPLAFCTWP